MRTLVSVLAFLLGLGWVAVAALNAWSLLQPADPALPPVWADQFPGSLRALGVGVELVLGAALLTGAVRRGLVFALGWLCVLTAVLLVFPVSAGASCGCAGPVDTSVLDPVARNVLLMGLHAGVLLAACGSTPKPSSFSIAREYPI